MILNKKLKLSVILPCKNEEQALEQSILKIKKVLSENGISGEIIVSDSSTDASPRIAKKLKVILVKHNKKGYGRAYLEGFKKAKGTYIFCADPDGSYDFEEIPRFLKHLESGYDLIIGNRFTGTMDKRAMPALNRYIGNPTLSFICRVIFKAQIHDLLCGMRGIRRRQLVDLNLSSQGMEFATEMIIKSIKKKLKIKEVPINYHKRVGSSKLRPFPDGFRHLNLMLREKNNLSPQFTRRLDSSLKKFI